MMRYVVGLLCFAGAGLLVWQAMLRKRRALAAGPEAAGTLHPSLQLIGDAVPPIIVVGLIIIGAKMTLAYVVADAGRYLSLFDLAGFLALLAGYGMSVVYRTRYRVSVPVPVQAQPVVATVNRATVNQATVNQATVNQD
jgi:hypothetical protein